MVTLKPQSNEPYSSAVIGTLAVDGYSEEGPGRGRSPPRPLIPVPNVTAHPSTASLPHSYYLTWHCNCLWTLKKEEEEVY